MAFQVSGYCDEIPYVVTVDTTATPAVIGSSRVQGTLDRRTGEGIAVTPTGPFVTLDLTDEATILAALMSWTTITAVTGDAPQVLPPGVAGAVY